MTASAKDLSGDANLTLPAWRGGVEGCVVLILKHTKHPAQPSKLQVGVSVRLVERRDTVDFLIASGGFRAT